MSAEDDPLEEFPRELVVPLFPMSSTIVFPRVRQAFDIVDRALDLTGGAGAFKRSRIEQLFRDIRMGRFHPGNTLLAHELIGKLCLGVNPDDPLRWG